MRRNQKLRVLLPFLLVCAVATATASQLTGVAVSSQGNLTTVTIRVAGTFTHTEYRPAENMLLLDLAGVSATKLDGKMEAIVSSGVQGYRVIGFRGTNGADVSRIELTVSPTATVKFAELEGGVEVKILGSKAPLPASQAVVDTDDTDNDAAPAVKPATQTDMKSAQAATTPAPAPAKPMQSVTAAKPMPPASTTSHVVTAQPVMIADDEPTPPAKNLKYVSNGNSGDETTDHQRAKGEQPVRVRDVMVTHGPQGMEVQISASGPMQPEAMRLENPDRVVIDLPNAMWNGAPRQIAVKAAEVKSVRMALYQLNPPVTRVVVDLTEARDYELLPSNTGLRVRLHALTANSAPAMPPAEQVATKATTAPQPKPAVMAVASTPMTEDAPEEPKKPEKKKSPPPPPPQTATTAETKSAAPVTTASLQPATTATTATPVTTPRSSDMPTSPIVKVSTTTATKPPLDASTVKSSPAVTVSMAKPVEKPSPVVVKQETPKPVSAAVVATPKMDQTAATTAASSNTTVTAPVTKPEATTDSTPAVKPKPVMAKTEQPAPKPTVVALAPVMQPVVAPTPETKPALMSQPTTPPAPVMVAKAEPPVTKAEPISADASPAEPTIIVTPAPAPKSTTEPEATTNTTSAAVNQPSSETTPAVTPAPTKPTPSVQSATVHKPDPKPAAKPAQPKTVAKTTPPPPKAEPVIQEVSATPDNAPKLQTAAMSEYTATEPVPAPKPAPAPVKPATPKTTTAPSKAVVAKPAAPVATPKPATSAQTSTAAAKQASELTTATAAPAPTANTKSAGPQEFVVLQPAYQPKTQEPQMLASANPPPPLTRAGDAASKFTPAPTEVAMSSTPAAGEQGPANPAQAQSAPSAPAAKPQAQMQSFSARPKYTGEPISVNLKDVDLKDFFRLIHEISGLNVVLDPNVHGSLTIVLDDVPWDQALDIVLKNNGLERELDGNVLRIATIDTLRHEADARRAQIEARSLADPKITVTRFLSYAHSKDIVPIVKKLLSQRGEIISDDRTNGLIIQDIPSVFPEIDRLLTQLDRKTPEVEIEARVVAATRNFARDIGTQFGFGWGNSGNALGGAGSVGPSPIIANTNPPIPYITTATSPATGSSAVPVQIPLFSNFPAVGPTSGLSFLHVDRNFRIDTILTLAESKGLLKILSRPRVVTQNNIQAVVRQGVRIPVVTLGQFNGPSTTTYIDAFLRLTVTPQITIENTIFLNVDVENTQADFGHQDSLGNPTLLTQQATTQVLVTDGGTVVIGGVIQTNNSVNIQQVPLLGNIPGLGNLFKRRSVSTETQELFFFITPKIIQT